MNGKAAVFLLSGMLFACAPPAPPPAPPPPAPAVPAPAAPVADAPREHRIVTIRTVTCGGLLAASEDDRAAASMFFIGYTAQRRRRAQIDIGEVDGIEAAALGYCAANPQQTAAASFMKAFADNGR